MYKKVTGLVLTGTLAVSTLLGGMSVSAYEIEDKKPIFSYGGSLTEGQKLDTKNLLEIGDIEIDEVEVVGEDMKTYLNSDNTTANMYSSAYLSEFDETDALVLEILTPENITEVSATQYTNAVITSGVKSGKIQIVSPVQVTGHSALVGIYKAFDEKGVELEQDRMEVAQEELDLITDISSENNGEEGFNTESLSNAFIDIKKGLSDENEKGELTQKTIDKVVSKALKDNNLEKVISEDQIADLVSFAEKYSKTSAITDSEVLDKLEDLAVDVKDKLKNATDDFGNKIQELKDDGFFDKVKDFFANIFDFFKGMFSSDIKDEAPSNEINGDENDEIIDENEDVVLIK